MHPSARGCPHAAVRTLLSARCCPHAAARAVLPARCCPHAAVRPLPIPSGRHDWPAGHDYTGRAGSGDTVNSPITVAEKAGVVTLKVA